jgi:hypothetical protein
MWCFQYAELREWSGFATFMPAVCRSQVEHCLQVLPLKLVKEGRLQSFLMVLAQCYHKFDLCEDILVEIVNKDRMRTQLRKRRGMRVEVEIGLSMSRMREGFKNNKNKKTRTIEELREEQELRGMLVCLCYWRLPSLSNITYCRAQYHRHNQVVHYYIQIITSLSSLFLI